MKRRVKKKRLRLVAVMLFLILLIAFIFLVIPKEIVTTKAIIAIEKVSKTTPSFLGLKNLIFPISADKLNQNKIFVEDIYYYIRYKDGIWKEIPKDNYIRVVFEKKLNKNNDIRIYAKSNESKNASVEVYEKDSNIKIADFGKIYEEKEYKIILRNLIGLQDTFDLKVIGGNVWFDYIVDPYVAISNGGIFKGTEDQTGTNFNHAAFSGLIWSNQDYDSNVFSYDAINPTRITVNEAGDYFVALSLPIRDATLSGSNNNRLNIEARVYVNGSFADVGLVRSSFLRGEGTTQDHFESGDQMALLVPNLGPGDYIEIQVRGLDDTAEAVEAEDGFALFVEKVEDSEEIFHGYGTTSTAPTSPTDLTQGGEQTYDYEMEWTSSIKDTIYTHIDGTSSVTLADFGYYYVTVNIPAVGDGTDRNVPCARVELDGIVVDGGQMIQGYIRSNSEGNEESSLHWAGLVETTGTSQILSVGVGPCSSVSATTTTGGENATLFVKKFANGNQGMFHSTATQVTGAFPDEWNPISEQKILWQAANEKDVTYYTHIDNTENITLNARGYYLLSFNSPQLTTGGLREAPQFRVYLDKVAQEGSRTGSTYMRDQSGSSESTTSLVYLLNATAGQNLTIGVRREISNTTTASVTDNDEGVILLEYKGDSVIAPNVIVNNPQNGTYYDSGEILLNVTISEQGECNYTLDEGTTNNTMGTFDNLTFNITPSLSNGIFSVRFYCFNFFEKVNASQSRTFTVDTIYPLISFETQTLVNNSNVSRNWIYTNVTFTEINFANITYSLYNQTKPINISTYTDERIEINWTNLPDDIYYYNVSIRDLVNHENQTETRKITLDTTFPNISFTVPTYENDSYVPQDSITVVVSADEQNEANIIFFLYNSTKKVQENPFEDKRRALTWTLLPDDSYYYNVTIIDIASNTNSTETNKITLDHIYPLVSYAPSSTQDNANLSQTFLFVNVSVTEINEANITFRLYNETHPVNISTYTDKRRVINWTNLPEGNYSYNVTVTDKSLFSNTTKKRIALLDTTYPLISFETQTLANNSNVSRNWIYTNVTFTETNFANITFGLYNRTKTINVSTYTDERIEINWTGLGDGIYFYNVSLTDKASQKNVTETRWITIDTTNPNATIISPLNNTYTNETTQNMTINATDNVQLSNITLFVFNESDMEINRTTWEVSGQSILTGILYTFAYDGIFNWFYRILDIASNQYLTQNNTIIIDTTYPLISYSGGTESNYANFSRNWIYVNVSTSETNFANITFELHDENQLINRTVYYDNRREINWTELPNKKYFYNVTIADKSYQINITTTQETWIDTTPPTVNIVRPQPKAYAYNISLPLNYTISDNLIGYDMCWWNLDNTANQTIACGTNTTFDTNDGQHTLYFFSNDTLNNFGITTVIFGISTQGPAMSLISPANDTFIDSPGVVQLSYTAEGPEGMTNCSLYGSWGGSWHLNQSTKGDGWWNETFLYRKKLNVTAVSVVTTNYTVGVVVDTLGPEFQDDGDDIRVTYWNGTENLEIDRLLLRVNDSETIVQFRLQNDLPAYAFDDNYSIYYGDPTADNPPDNGSTVWYFYEDFSSGLSKWGYNSGITVINTTFLNPWTNQYSTLELGRCGDAFIKVLPSFFPAQRDIQIRALWMDNPYGACTGGSPDADGILGLRGSASGTYDGLLVERDTDTGFHYDVGATGVTNNPWDYSPFEVWQWSENQAYGTVPAGHRAKYWLNNETEPTTYQLQATGVTATSPGLPFLRVASGTAIVAAVFASVLVETEPTVEIQSEYWSGTFNVTIENDGGYGWNVQCFDNNHVGAFALFNNSFFLDTQNPQISYNPNTDQNNTNVSKNFIFVNVSVTEQNEKNITFALYNGTSPVNISTYMDGRRIINWTNLPEGIYKFNVTVFDRANRSNYTETRFVRLDRTSPGIITLDPSNDTYTNQPNQNMSVSASDTNGLANLTLFIYNELGELINYTTRFVAGTGAVIGITYTFLTEGIFNWFYDVFDVAGNRNETSNNTIIIDITFPLIDYDLGMEEDYENVSNNWVYINVTVTETNEQNITFSLYKEEVFLTEAFYTSPIREVNFTSLADGNYSYNVTIFDKASQKNSTITRRIFLDNQLPNASLIDPEDYYFTSETLHNFTYNASDEQGLNISTLFIFNETGSLIYNITQTLFGTKSIISGNIYNFVTDGIFYWFYRVFDISGNKYDTDNRTITLDFTYPQITFVPLTKDNNSTVHESFIYLNVTVTENNEENITFYLYNSTAKVQENFFDYARREVNWTLLPDEYYFYNVTVFDSAGNYNTSETRKIILDKIPPAVDYELPTSINTFNSSRNWIFVNVSVNEINEANITFQLHDYVFELNKSTYTDERRTINWTGLSDGTYFYNVTVVDKASQNTTTLTRQINLDATYPLISFGASTPPNYSNLSQSFIYIDISATETNEANVTFSLYNAAGVVNQSTYTNKRRNINWTDVPYGNVTYYYNVTIVDFASNTNYTQTREIFLYDSVKPYLKIINPEERNYTSNDSLSFDFIVIEPNVQFCWYNIDGSSNITLTNCQNTTISVSDEEYHTIYLFANDTSGNQNITTRTFFANSSDISTPDYKVQRGSNSVTGSATEGIQEADPKKSFFLLNPRSTSSAPNALQVIPSFVDSEEIRFENYGGTADVEWELISGPDISVQRGEYAYGTTGATINISISQINLSSSFIIIHNRLDSVTAGTNAEGKWVGQFINSTFIQLDRGDTGTSGEVSWQVVDWDSATVRRGAFSTAGASGFVGIGATIPLEKTFLIFSERFVGTSTLESSNMRGRFDDSQYLQFLRVGTQGTAYVEWFVVSSDVFEVQNGSFIINNTYAPVFSELQELKNVSRAFNRHSKMSAGTGTTYANSVVATDIFNSTHHRAQIGSDAGNVRTVNWQVIELVEKNPPTVNLLTPNNTNFSNHLASLDYIVEDQNTIPNCTLYGNWGGSGWKANETNSSQVREALSTFSNINVENDGYYLWNVRCYDLYGNMGENSTNFTFAAFLPPESFDEEIFNLTQTSNDGEGNVTLIWNLSNHSIKYYVYYADDPSQEFSLLGETTSNNYTDTTANETRRRFYMVSGWNPSGENYSSIYGKTVYHLKRKQDINTRNWISLYLETNLTTANESLYEINNITSFTMYNSTLQTRVTCNLFSCPAFPSCTETNCDFNFTLENATGYEVNVNSSYSTFSNWSLVGKVKEPTSKPLVRNATSFGNNWISIYYNTSLDNAYDLINSMSFVDAVTYWDPLQQTTKGYLKSPFPGIPYIGTNFDIEPETAYEVSIQIDTTYTQT